MTTIEKSAIHHGPISKEVLLLCKEHLQEKVIDLAAFKQATISADDYEKTTVTEAGLADLDPLHAVYVYAQNLLSVLVEQISELPHSPGGQKRLGF